MKMKEGSEKDGLKLNIKLIMASHYFMANRWGNSGNSGRLYLLGSEITADGDCSHEIKRHLLLGRKSPLDCKEIQPDHSKGDQPWVYFGRTDAEAETPVLWPPHVKS